MKALRLFIPLLTLGIMSPLAAQNVDTANERIAKIKIIKNINGEVTVIEKEIPVNGKTDIDEMLRDLDISESIDAGENIEIIIRQGGDNHPRMPWMGDFSMDDRPLLGVYLGSTVEKVITDENGETTVEIEEGSGSARITGIVPGSGAEAAGLKEGDVITAIDDQPVSDYGSLVEVIGQHQVGDVVTVHFEREGVGQSVQATLGKREHPQPMPFMGPMHGMMMPGGPDMMMKMCDPDRGFLGVHIRDLEEGESGHGAVITDVVDSSAAFNMGLKEGDILVEINDQPVNNVAELQEVIGNTKGGEEVKVEYVRDGKKSVARGTLGKCDISRCMPDMSKVHEQIMKSIEGMDWKELHQQFDSEGFEEHMRQLEDKLKDMRFEFDMDEDGSPGDFRMIAVMIRVDDITDEDKELLQKNNPGLELNNSLDVSRLSFSPNPSNGQFELSFELSDKSPVTVRIFDPNGREVYNQRIEDFDGTYSNNIDITGNADGTYFLIVEQNGKTFSRKVIVQ